ncbi:hypothetical protein LG331_08090 [Vreelandella aquamarina]|uniref:hypothetical protein n=1 Tax=Vreelandella aquamarina TaxID=77097 RepID=UPI00384B659E
MSPNDDHSSKEAEEKVTSSFPQEIMEIRGDEVTEFFSQFENDAVCPLCGHDEMELMAAPEYEEDGKVEGFSDRPAISAITIDERPDIKRGMKSPAFSLSCTRCGYFSYVLVGKFLAWKRKNEAKK